jgi:hypothetical protein
MAESSVVPWSISGNITRIMLINRSPSITARRRSTTRGKSASGGNSSISGRICVEESLGERSCRTALPQIFFIFEFEIVVDQPRGHIPGLARNLASGRARKPASRAKTRRAASMICSRLSSAIFGVRAMSSLCPFPFVL